MTFQIPTWFALLLLVAISTLSGMIVTWLYLVKTQQVGSGVVRGKAIVLDADDITIHGINFRLNNIDAIEKRTKQLCCRNNKPWNCQRDSSAALVKLISNTDVSCKSTGKASFNRPLGVCRVGNISINDWLVRNGWALASTQYSYQYFEAEEEAKANKRGIWAGSFIRPADHRKFSKIRPKPACIKNPCVPCEAK